MSVNKAAAAIVGSAIAALIVLALLWSFAGGIVKAYAPNELGYSRLGWVRAGSQTIYHFGVPRWAGWAGFLSAMQAPLRHYKIRLEQGQKIVVDYRVQIDRGAMTLHVYRTNLSTLLQGVLVEDMEFRRLRPGTHAGTFTYTAPQDGIYEFDYDVWWDKEASRSRKFPLPDYDLVYDISWRLERQAMGTAFLPSAPLFAAEGLVGLAGTGTGAFRVF